MKRTLSLVLSLLVAVSAVTLPVGAVGEPVTVLVEVLCLRDVWHVRHKAAVTGHKFLHGAPFPGRGVVR